MSKIKFGKVLGLFAPEAIPMSVELEQYPQIPSLLEQTQKAVEVLSQNPNGFVLMVEAGKIDWAAHGNDAGALFREMQVLDEVLGYVQYNPKKLVRQLEQWDTKSVKTGKISMEEGKEFLSNYRSGLYGYTYLEHA